MKLSESKAKSDVILRELDVVHGIYKGFIYVSEA